jgi:alcohol dehydrogenase class IV
MSNTDLRVMERVPPFTNNLPVRIRFGDGVARELADAVAAHSARRVLVVIDDGLEESADGVAAALAGIRDAGIGITRFAKPPGEPTIAMVDSACASLGRSGADAVVAIGGGSVIDTAKVARLCARQHRTFSEFLRSERDFPWPDVPLLALPTTAGTGSEVSGGAVISDPAETRKTGIAHPNLRTQDALVDPLLTHSVPPALTAYTGIDALAQAIAAMIARDRTPIGDAVALEAIRLAGRSLVAAYRDGQNGPARSQMACASLLAGLAMNISDCTAEHSLAQAIGGLFHAPHGLTVGVVLAETLDRERRYVPDQLERVADALGIHDDGSGDGSRAVNGVRTLLAELEFPLLRSLGVEEGHLDALTELALDDFFHTQSPEPWNADDLRQAFAAALAQSERRTIAIATNSER